LWVGFTDAAASAGKDRLDKIVKRTALAVADRALARKAGGFKSTEEEVTFLKRLGWVLYRLDAADRSVDAFRRALEIDPTDSAARVQLGETLQKLGRNTEAIAEFDKLKKPRKPKK
jgi:tetratricopeptide (TPR) repeat protein